MEKNPECFTTIKQWLQITDYYMTTLDNAFNVGNTQTHIESERNNVFYLNLVF